MEKVISFPMKDVIEIYKYLYGYYSGERDFPWDCDEPPNLVALKTTCYVLFESLSMGLEVISAEVSAIGGFGLSFKRNTLIEIDNDGDIWIFWGKNNIPQLTQEEIDTIDLARNKLGLSSHNRDYRLWDINYIGLRETLEIVRREIDRV